MSSSTISPAMQIRGSAAMSGQSLPFFADRTHKDPPIGAKHKDRGDHNAPNRDDRRDLKLVEADFDGHTG